MDGSDLKRFMLDIAPDIAKLPAAIQLRAFELLLEEHRGSSAPPDPSQHVTGTKKIAKRTSSPKAGSGHQKAVELTLVRSLDLRGTKDVPSLKDFANEKRPSTNIEFNAVSVYYLKRLLQEDKVGPSHIYTCYKFCGRRSPKNTKGFVQSLYDTSSKRYGYIDATDLNDIKSSMLGENLVEHDLPKKVKG